MAHSLEVREPLMDHPLVEWLASLPSDMKLNGNEGKHLLKSAMAPYLPAELLYRAKQGFAVPLARWFRGPLRQRVQDAILGPRLAATGIFNQNYLQYLVEAHASGARDYSAPLWTLLMFDAFLKNVMEGDGRIFQEKAAGWRCVFCMSWITRSRCRAVTRSARAASSANSAGWDGKRSI